MNGMFSELELELVDIIMLDFDMHELEVKGNLAGYCRHDVICDSIFAEFGF